MKKDTGGQTNQTNERETLPQNRNESANHRDAHEGEEHQPRSDARKSARNNGTNKQHTRIEAQAETNHVKI